jgi:hypothetical protein
MHSTFEDCLKRAEAMTKSYRLEYDPLGEYPQNWYVSTTLIVMALVSAAVSAAGTYVSSQAQSDANKYNAAIAKNNATSAAQQGEFDAQQIRDKNRRTIAQQRNAFAANGIVPDSGSAADVSADSKQQGEMQALMAIYTGRTSATAYDAQARLDSMQAGNAQTAGYIGMGTTILGGVSSAAAADAGSRNPTFIK